MAEREIRELLDRQVENGRVAGHSLLILKEGKELFYYQGGYANLAAKTPFLRDSIVRLYSMTKPVTAVAAFQLIEQGKLSLSSGVKEILPAYGTLYVMKNGERVKAGEIMTVKDLLDMTSGLTYGGKLTRGRQETEALFQELQDRMMNSDDSAAPPMTTREFADRLAECTLEFQPGTAWRYGTSADVLGAVIEAVSGESLEEYFRNHIFRPLSICDTSFYVPEEKVGRLTMSYSNSRGYLAERHHPELGVGHLRDYKNPPAFQSGGGGLYGTIDDYARFGTMLLNGGTLDGVRILSERLVRYMTECQLTPGLQAAFQSNWRKQAGFTYGGLVRKCLFPNQTFYLSRQGEYGWGGALGTKFYNLPEEKVTIVYFSQLMDGEKYGYHEALRNLIDTML